MLPQISTTQELKTRYLAVLKITVKLTTIAHRHYWLVTDPNEGKIIYININTVPCCIRPNKSTLIVSEIYALPSARAESPPIGSESQRGCDPVRRGRWWIRTAAFVRLANRLAASEWFAASPVGPDDAQQTINAASFPLTALSVLLSTVSPPNQLCPAGRRASVVRAQPNPCPSLPMLPVQACGRCA